MPGGGVEVTVKYKAVSSGAATGLVAGALKAAKSGKAGDALLGIASLFTSLNAKPTDADADGGTLAFI